MKPLLSIILLFIAASLSAQAPEKIRIRSEDQLVYLLQKGKNTDTISYNNSDLFFLKTAPGMRCKLRIDVENGNFTHVQGDTLYRLRRVNNINYTHDYVDTLGFQQVKDAPDRCRMFRVGINGYNAGDQPNTVTIKVYDSSRERLLFSHRFFYR